MIVWEGTPLLVQLRPGGTLRYYYSPYCQFLPDVPAINPATAPPGFTRCVDRRSRCPRGSARPPVLRGDGQLCPGRPKKFPCVASGQLRFRSPRSDTVELESPAGGVEIVKLTAGVATRYFPLFFMDSYDGIWSFRNHGKRHLVLIGFGQRWTVDVGGDEGMVTVKAEEP